MRKLLIVILSILAVQSFACVELEVEDVGQYNQIVTVNIPFTFEPMSSNQAPSQKRYRIQSWTLIYPRLYFSLYSNDPQDTQLPANGDLMGYTVNGEQHYDDNVMITSAMIVPDSICEHIDQQNGVLPEYPH